MIFTAASSAFMYARTITGGVDVLLQERLREMQDLARQDDHRGGAVADFLILRARELDHRLRRGVRHVDLAQNRVAVVRQHDACVEISGGEREARQSNAKRSGTKKRKSQHRVQKRKVKAE
jgi:hypothetical protein